MGELKLEKGDRGSFEFYRESDGVKATLYHEKKYGRKTKEIRTFLLTHKPDIVLEVKLPSGQEFIWLFDAKYRISDIKTNQKNQFVGKPKVEELLLWQGKTEEEKKNAKYPIKDGVPDDAINQMHRYRDALIRLSESPSSSTTGQPAKKSRPVFGAFALYPGFFDQATTPNPYAAAIEEVGIGAFALLPSQNEPSQNELSQTDTTQTKSCYSGHQWLLEFLQAQIGTPAAYTTNEMAEALYMQEPARIPYHGMQQALYPDLTMTIGLGGQSGRNNHYFEAFKKGTAQYYHLPVKTFTKKFKQHVAEEIRYLALASTSDSQRSSKQIDKLWPVKHVTMLPRYKISEAQAGKKSTSAEMYYLFELSKPLSLQSPVTNVPHRPIRNTMKLTTLTRLESVSIFSGVEKVYEEAMK